MRCLLDITCIDGTPDCTTRVPSVSSHRCHTQLPPRRISASWQCLAGAAVADSFLLCMPGPGPQRQRLRAPAPACAAAPPPTPGSAAANPHAGPSPFGWPRWGGAHAPAPGLAGAIAPRSDSFPPFSCAITHARRAPRSLAAKPHGEPRGDASACMCMSGRTL